MTKAVTILAVEDEESIRDMLSYSLEREGYTVLCVANVAAAKAVLKDTQIDAALVDWMLPGASGLEFVRSLRNSDPTRDLPIIMLTARTEIDDVTTGLDAGADDYMCKPFSPKELSSRIKALLRRSVQKPQHSSTIEAGPLQLDTNTHRAQCKTNSGDLIPLELGHTEFKLLRFFMEHPERVFSRAQLLDHVWGNGTFIEERTVDVHILRVRKILKPAGAEKLLETVRGAGYRLSVNDPA